MAKTSAEHLFNPGRMLADGIPYHDLVEAQTRIQYLADWFDFWAKKGSHYHKLAERAFRDGHILSGGEWLWQASLSFHFAQFMWFHDPELREEGHRRAVALYKDAASYLVPRAQRVELSVQNHVLPGYLRLPAPRETYEPSPCVLLLGGLESTKEESYLFENICLRRGLATFAFDGPGQGEMYLHVKLRPDFERYTSLVVDYLATRPEIDITRIGILGRSLGGHYALRSAAYDHRFRACVAWGALFDMSEFDAMPPGARQGFVYVSGIPDPAKAKKYLQEALNLADVAAMLRCPVYILHGRRDAIVSMKQVEKLGKTLPHTRRQIVIENSGDHCCHNMAHIVRPRMADWLAAELDANHLPT